MPKARAKPKSSVHELNDTDSWHRGLTCDLEISLLVDKKVLRLQVSMQDSVGVAVIQAFDQLEGEFLRGRR